METNQLATESALASDTAAEKLGKFVAENRQHLPPLPVRPDFSHLSFVNESPEIAAERDAKIAEQAEARRLSELNHRFHDLVLAAGRRYLGCTLTNFETPTNGHKQIVKALSEYISNDSREGVILYGPVGTGKDHLAFAVCRAATKAGRTVRWINGQQWFGAVRDAMDTDRSEASLVSELARPEVLCISDPLPPVGALTQHQATMLYRLIDARYSKGLPTVCTINVSSDQEADERMGAATWDRLTHDAYKLFCNWPSYRKPAREV